MGGGRWESGWGGGGVGGGKEKGVGVRQVENDILYTHCFKWKWKSCVLA